LDFYVTIYAFFLFLSYCFEFLTKAIYGTGLHLILKGRKFSLDFGNLRFKKFHRNLYFSGKVLPFYLLLTYLTNIYTGYAMPIYSKYTLLQNMLFSHGSCVLSLEGTFWPLKSKQYFNLIRED